MKVGSRYKLKSLRVGQVRQRIAYARRVNIVALIGSRSRNQQACNSTENVLIAGCPGYCTYDPDESLVRSTGLYSRIDSSA